MTTRTNAKEEPRRVTMDDARILQQQKKADMMILVAIHGDTYSIASFGNNRATCLHAQALGDSFEDRLRGAWSRGGTP